MIYKRGVLFPLISFYSLIYRETKTMDYDKHRRNKRVERTNA